MGILTIDALRNCIDDVLIELAADDGISADDGEIELVGDSDASYFVRLADVARVVRDDTDTLRRENVALRNSLESVVDGRAAILALVRGEDVPCDGWLVELEQTLKERLQRSRKNAALGALEIARKQFNSDEFDTAHAMMQGCIEYVQQVGANGYIDDEASNGK